MRAVSVALTAIYLTALTVVLTAAACSVLQQAEWNMVACDAQAAANAFTDATAVSNPLASAFSVRASALFGSQCVPMSMLVKA